MYDCEIIGLLETSLKGVLSNGAEFVFASEVGNCCSCSVTSGFMLELSNTICELSPNVER